MHASVAIAAALALLVGDVPAASTPPDSGVSPDRFDGLRVAGCLQQARRSLDQHADFFADAHAWLDAGGALRGVDPFTLQQSPFADFEGAWCGSWDGAPVRHVWRSVARDTQLVLVEDRGVAQHGINHRDADGTLCGVVRQADGRERVHEGRRIVSPGGGASWLQWTTPSRRYIERVVRTPSGPRYEIVEEVLTPDATVPGVTAAYGVCEAPAV